MYAYVCVSTYLPTYLYKGTCWVSKDNGIPEQCSKARGIPWYRLQGFTTAPRLDTQATPLRRNSILPLTHYELLSLKFNTSFKGLFLQPLLPRPVSLLLTVNLSAWPWTPPGARAAQPHQIWLVGIKHRLLALLPWSWHTRRPKIF